MIRFCMFVSGISAALGALPCHAQQLGDGPVILESGWSLESDFAFSEPISALINPDDGFIYVGSRAGDIYRADSIGNTEMLLNTSQIAGIAFDPNSGSIFYSEDFPGTIRRVTLNPDGTASQQLWVSGFQSGDDDPVGLAAVPNDYVGTLLNPGDMVSTDRGFNGPNQVWTWSPVLSEGETLVRDDNGSLTDPFDIAVKGDTIVIADSLAGLKRLNDDASVTPITIDGVSFSDVQGVVFDTRSDDLLVLDTGLDAIYRVDLVLGEATLMFDQLGLAVTNWGGINIADDGTTQRIVVSATGGNRVFVFSITPPCSPADLAGPFGELNFFDVSAFLSAYTAQDPVADFNDDGLFNFFDVSGFLSAYSMGCP